MESLFAVSSLADARVDFLPGLCGGGSARRVLAWGRRASMESGEANLRLLPASCMRQLAGVEHLYGCELCNESSQHIFDDGEKFVLRDDAGGRIGMRGRLEVHGREEEGWWNYIKYLRLGGKL